MSWSWGEPPWRRREFPTRPLELLAPDVAIIGGGLTGVSAAYYLARRGVKTVVLEAGRIGDGASGRTGGIVLEGTASGILDGTDACLAALERLVREERISCDLRLPGCWEIEHRRGTGGDTLPWSDGGLPVRISGTVAGGTVDPAALLAGLAHAASHAGALLHEQAPVKRLLTGSRPSLELEGMVLRPAHVIVAVNAWIGALLPNVRQFASALTFACATQPLDASAVRDIGLGPGLPFYTVDLPYLWGREISDRRVIFGAGLAFGSPRELEWLDAGADGPGAALDALETRIRKLHPALAEVRFSARWAGPIAIPDNRTPLLGALPGAPPILVAGGYAGHGIALSVWAGETLARGIVEREPLPSWGAVGR